jgi:hypothetical protein
MLADDESKALATQKERVQQIANETRTPRWVVRTSLGWRIEWYEPTGWQAPPFFRFDPQEVKNAST